MKFQKAMQTTPWLSGLVLAAVLSSTALAQNGMMGRNGGAPQASSETQTPAQAPPYGYGPGMMYGYGPGARSGYGPMMMWNGAGPAGMRGPGMMPGYGYGMMYGDGYGPGMMYDYGGMPESTLNLSAQQRQSLGKLWRTEASQQGQLRGQLFQYMEQMRNLMAESNPDPKAVGQVYDHIATTRRQLLVNSLQMRTKFQNILTPEQRKRWRQDRPWCAGGWQHNGDD
ncbi:Spy/CpxP family protein refolding chaperone [Salinisphaera sp. RV14]|uniref:Spy/CpxP family protein refolding chaperone n=1 Tax=unclassified Salinisphaera TaxID=2649847 RepID=UPI003F86CC15